MRNYRRHCWTTQRLIGKSMMVNHPKLELVELTVFLEFRVYGYFVEFGSTGGTWRQKEMR